MSSLQTIELKRFPDWVEHGGEQTAPGAGAALATIGPLAVRPSLGIAVAIQINADDSVPTYEIAHRNAANSADLDVSYVPAGSTVANAIFVAQSGEYIVVRAKTAATAGKVYQVDLNAWRL